jgi:Winged helix DNA-binding domain
MPPPITLSPRALNRATLARQMLLARARISASDAVARLAGLQAQLARPPFVGLWSRVEGFTREQLVAAIDRRDVVRGTLMRGTIHLVTRDHYEAFRPAVQPALTAGMRAILKDRMRGLDVEGLVAAAREVFGKAPCTFAALRARLAKRFPGLDERVMGYVARMQLPLVQVPEAGAAWAYPGTADFALADTWLGQRIDTTGPADALVLSYLAAFGPATLKDLQTWSYVPGLEPVLDRLRRKLRTFRDEKGRELFDLPKAPRPGEDEPAPVRFLPEYDNLLLAHADRTRIVADAHRKAMSTKNLVQPATLLVDGLVAGTWTVAASKRAAALTVVPFAKIPKPARPEIEVEGERLLGFVEPAATTRTIEIAPPRE